MSGSRSPENNPFESSSIPVEIFERILENVPQDSLPSVARASSSFNELSEKLIYRNLELTSMSQASQCFETLRKKPGAAESVRELVIMIKDSRAYSSKFGPMLANALRSLSRLTALHLAIDGPYLPALNDCQFPYLTSFSTTVDLLPSPAPLVEFLVRHGSISTLCLGGDSSFPGVNGDPNSKRTFNFQLPHTALTRLETYMGSRRLVPAVVSQRPVRKVTLAWHSPNIESEIPFIIPPLRSTSTPLESFSAATPGWSGSLIRALARFLPFLIALRLFNTSGDYHNEIELFNTISNTLKSFPNLARLELPCHRNIRTIMTLEAEMKTSYQWASLAPRLRFVVFPSSRVWLRDDKGRWDRAYGS